MLFGKAFQILLFHHIGVPIVNGSTARLPQLVGLSRALDLILTGRSVTAREAYEIGLATKLTACGTGEFN